MSKTKRLNQMMIKISEYWELHESCIHVCLPQITVNPHLNSDDGDEDEDVGMCCYYDGIGIFCLPSNYAKVDCIRMDPRYDKEIVPLKKHIHCNCEKAENINILCDVHEDPEDYLETINFTKQNYLKVGGYEEEKSYKVTKTWINL